MTVINEWFAAILLAIPFPFLVPLLGAIVGGEETILVISALSAGGALSFPLLLVMSFLGTMISDSGWFYFGRIFTNWIERKESLYARLQMIERFTHRVTNGNDFLALLMTKFLYGTRLMMIFYLARKRMSYRQFIRYNTIVTGVWTIAVCSIGWAAGLGVSWATDVFDNLSIGIIIFVAALVLLYGARIWLNKTIIETAI